MIIINGYHQTFFSSSLRRSVCAQTQRFFSIFCTRECSPAVRVCCVFDRRREKQQSINDEKKSKNCFPIPALLMKKCDDRVKWCRKIEAIRLIGRWSKREASPEKKSQNCSWDRLVMVHESDKKSFAVKIFFTLSSCNYALTSFLSSFAGCFALASSVLSCTTSAAAAWLRLKVNLSFSPFSFLLHSIASLLPPVNRNPMWPSILSPQLQQSMVIISNVVRNSHAELGELVRALKSQLNLLRREWVVHIG